MFFFTSEQKDSFLSESEQRKIDSILPLNQIKVFYASHVNIIFDNQNYKNGILILSEHFVTLYYYSLFGFFLNKLTHFHISDIVSIIIENQNSVGIKILSKESLLKLESDNITDFIQKLIYIYNLNNSMMPNMHKFQIESNDSIKIDSITDFNDILSPSQKFQITYNLMSSYYNSNYDHDVSIYFYNLIQSKSPIFDFNELPNVSYECGLGISKDIRPITSSLMFQPDIIGINCSELSRNDIFGACSTIVIANPNIKIMRIIESGSKTGCTQLANAINKAENPRIAFWDFSNHQLEDIGFFIEALEHYKSEVEALILNNCALSTANITSLISALITNEKLHSIKKIALLGVHFNKSNCEQFSEFIDKISGVYNLNQMIECSHSNSENSICQQSAHFSLKYLEVGPIDDSKVVIKSLFQNHVQLSILKIIDTYFNSDSVSLFTDFLSQSKMLSEIDISGSSFINDTHDIIQIIRAILSNPCIISISMHLSRLSINNEKYSLIMNEILKNISFSEKIRELYLDSNGMTMKETVVEDILKLTKLQTISLSLNYKQEMKGIGSYLTGILNHTCLKALHICGDRDKYFLGDEVFPLIDALSNSNNRIEELDLSGNAISDAGILSLTKMLEINPCLKTIFIDDNIPTKTQSLYEFLNTVSKSSSIVNTRFPINDVYCILEAIGKEYGRDKQMEEFEMITTKKMEMQYNIHKNQIRNGISSNLSFLHDPILDSILEISQLEERKELHISEDERIYQLFGLIPPYDNKFKQAPREKNNHHNNEHIDSILNSLKSSSYSFRRTKQEVMINEKSKHFTNILI